MAAKRPTSCAAALERDLAGMPDVVRHCVEAMAARELARQIDQGLGVTAAARELAAQMVRLRSRAGELAAPAEPVEPPTASGKGTSGVSDLAARIAARRRSSSG